MSLADAWRRGEQAAREALSVRKDASLARLLLDDIRQTVAELPGALAEGCGLENLAGNLGRLRHDAFSARRLLARWAVWARLRGQPMLPVHGNRWVYSFSHHRIGDKVVCSALFQYLRLCQPSAYLVLIDDQLDERAGHRLPTAEMFAGLADAIWTITEPADRLDVARRVAEQELQTLAWTRDLRPIALSPDQLCCSGEPRCSGMPWLLLPRLAKLGVYPRLKVPQTPLPASVETALARAAGRPLVVVHILDDAPYNTERNQAFACFEGLVEQLQATGRPLFLVRVGRASDRRLSLPPELGCDLTPDGGLNLAQTAVLLARAQVFVGGDSGPIHLAAALGVPRLTAVYGYSYSLEFTLRHCFGCVRNTALAEQASCFPSVRAERLQQVLMRAHRFDPVKVARLVCEQLASLAG